MQWQALILVHILFENVEQYSLGIRRVSTRCNIMKVKSVIFSLSFCLLLLSGCVASVGPEYGYYPPTPRPYYGYARPYYNPRPVIVVPRGGYGYGRPHYEGNRYGGGYGGGRGYGNGGYGGGGGRGRHGRD